MELSKRVVTSEAELQAWVPDILESLRNHKVITLEGDLGAGKTTLVKYLCEAWGVVDPVTSPTFSLINVYLRHDDHPVYHMDLYRLESLEEALDIGIEEYLDSGEMVLVEWPELIETLLPPGVIRIRITREAGEQRKIVLLTDQ